MTPPRDGPGSGPERGPAVRTKEKLPSDAQGMPSWSATSCQSQRSIGSRGLPHLGHQFTQPNTGAVPTTASDKSHHLMVAVHARYRAKF